MKCEDLKAFIRGVCAWGDYAAIADRVLQENASGDIERKVGNAISVLSSRSPDLVGGLKSMLEIKELGVVTRRTDAGV
jgi:hypothetical protein